MITVRVTKAVVASPGEVWALIGDFGTLDHWHPWVPNCGLDTDGTRRTIDLGDTRAVEVLDPVASGEWSQVYTVDTSPMPVEDYRAKLHVEPDGSGRARIVWEARFRSTDPTAPEQIRAFFAKGLESVAAKL